MSIAHAGHALARMQGKGVVADDESKSKLLLRNRLQNRHNLMLRSAAANDVG